MENIILKTEDIVKQYANHRALDKVSISVPQNSIYGLLGPNGAGKTSLIRIINQITAPDEGKIWFKGESLKSKHIGMIGYLPEERGLYKKMKVGEQAIYLSQLKGVPKAVAMKRLKYWFERFEIENWWNKKVEELSKGMQQKVQFIVTIIHEPEFLIFDEPFSGFDPINTEILKQEILRLKENGATIIFSTHNMSSVEELCDNIALIDNSKKILEGKVSDIKDQYKENRYSICIQDFNQDIHKLMEGIAKVEHCELSGNKTNLRVKLFENSSSNEFLHKILPHGHISFFNEILPSMNDIFISNVQDKDSIKVQ
ncbi:MAG: ABC transporter ATP-binding protein [Bacteroidales bacterium]